MEKVKVDLESQFKFPNFEHMRLIARKIMKIRCGD
jgi:hypothetical protein